jgi:large subunit ribosomal protein L6
MSRIGKKIIQIPEGVTATVSGLEVTVKGPKGELKAVVSDRISVTVDDTAKAIVLKPINPETDSAVWGTTRANVANMVLGVSQGWSKGLELSGVGFRMEMRGKKLVMRLGFSHEVEYDMPEGVNASVENSVLTIAGTDKQLVGQVAAEVRGLKKPEPYKGKGFHYTDEVIRRKAGKAAKGE